MTTSRRTLLGASAAALLSRALRAAETCDPTTTPAQVLGPFVPHDFDPRYAEPKLGVKEHDLDLSRVGEQSARGQVIVVEGRVSASCTPLEGATVRLWQADAAGHYNHGADQGSAALLDPGFGYWTTATTDALGRFTIRTIVPGSYPAGPGWIRPPHLHWWIEAKGHARLDSQTYFDGDPIQGIADIRALNDKDPILHLRDGFESLARGTLDHDRAEAERQLVLRFQAGAVPTAQALFELA